MSGLDAPLLASRDGADRADDSNDEIMAARTRNTSAPPAPSAECVFVARFDVNTGNTIEWAHPFAPEQLEGLEFKALASGSHMVEEDYVLFQFHGLYGIACFNKLLDPDAPRGAWQCAAGVLVSHHYYLEQHIDELKRAAKQANLVRGDYTLLEKHYKEWSVGGAASGFGRGKLALSHPASLSARGVAHYLQKLSLACGSVWQLINFFGERVFVLWRAMLMGLRVVYLSAPPVGEACSRLHTAYGLLITSEDNHRMLALPAWLYYITVADIDTLKDIAQSYLACTTDQIFKHKPDLYDLLIEGGSFVPSKRHEKALKVLPGDRDLFTELQSKTDPLSALAFFEQLNNRLLQHVKRWRRGTPLTRAAVTKCGLNMDSAERFFAHNGYDIQTKVGCCPLLGC